MSLNVRIGEGVRVHRMPTHRGKRGQHQLPRHGHNVARRLIFSQQPIRQVLSAKCSLPQKILTTPSHEPHERQHCLLPGTCVQGKGSGSTLNPVRREKQGQHQSIKELLARRRLSQQSCSRVPSYATISQAVKFDLYYLTKEAQRPVMAEAGRAAARVKWMNLGVEVQGVRCNFRLQASLTSSKKSVRLSTGVPYLYENALH